MEGAALLTMFSINLACTVYVLSTIVKGIFLLINDCINIGKMKD